MTRVPLDSASTMLAGRPHAAARAFVELGKPGITRMVTITAGTGFAIAAMLHGLAVSELVVPALACLIGTAVSSMGANALNEVIEWRADARMARTRGRPIPSGRLSIGASLAFACCCSVLGPLVLAMLASHLAGAIAAATILLYAFVYTPLKTVTSGSILVGAIPGALPVLIGWLAASPDGWADLRAWPAWSVFGVLLVWQIPHFLAIASLYRDEYAAAGYRMIPGDVDDRMLGGLVIAWTAALLAVSVGPLLAMPGQMGWVYALAAGSVGCWFLSTGIRMRRSPSRQTTRAVFLASIGYLPVVMLALVLDAFIA
ncbi:MAG: heme o synthase [Planctomycetota bacterium]